MNSQVDNKHGVSELLKGNNVIFANKQEKYETLKELIVSFYYYKKETILHAGQEWHQ